MVGWAKLPAIRCVLSTPVETVPATELWSLWRITDQLMLGLFSLLNSRMAQEISWYWNSLRFWTSLYGSGDQLILGLSSRLNNRLCMAQEISWYWNSLRFWAVVFVWLRRSADIGTLSASELSSLYGSEDQLILELSPLLNCCLFMAQEISWYWGTLSSTELSSLYGSGDQLTLGLFLFLSGRGSEINWWRDSSLF